jgi:chromosome segregation ATPase
MTMDELGQEVVKALTGLQAFELVSAEYVGLEDKLAQTQAQVEATQRELEKLKTELAHAQTSLAQAQAEHVRRHNDQMDEKHSSQREYEIAIGELNGKLTGLEAQIREKQAEHHAVVLGLDAVKQRLNV